MDDGRTARADRPLQAPPVARLETAGSVLLLIGPSGRKLQFPHENIKSIPPGSNPSKRHRADRRIIVPSDQEPSRAVQPQASRPAVGRCEPRIGGNEHGQQRDDDTRSVRLLRIRAASAGKSATDARLPRNSQDAVVFIIDDDVAVREALHNLLRDVRLQAEGFGSPTEFLASKLPDAASCLVLDIRLPGVGGLDFQAELARANIGIPIIFMTGYADIPMAARAMKAGAVDFLTKPFREQDMLDAVAIAIERDRAYAGKAIKPHLGCALCWNFSSPREREVMALVTSGLMNKQVAAKTGLAEIDGEDTSRTRHEEDGSEVPRRSHQDG